MKIRPVSGGLALGVVQTIRWRKHEAFPARSANRYAEEIRRCPNGIRTAAVETVLGMEETEKDVAVAHGAAQGNFSGGLEWFFQSECFEPVAIVGHHIGIAAVSPEDQPAHLARVQPTRMPRAAVTEIKARPHD